MVGVLPVNLLDSMKCCANCVVYDWKQPTNKDLLKRCTGCRMIWYCGEMCQKEHWHHTHKNQCKYLSRKKVLHNAKHEEASCLVCKKEVAVGKKEMSKQSNPILPCTMSRANRDIMNIDESVADGWPCFALAEMTGEFHTKVEAIIATFMRILMKMKITKYLLWQRPSTAAALDNLYMMLWKRRIVYLGRTLTLKKPGPIEGQLEIERIDAQALKGIYEEMIAVEKIRQAARCESSFAGKKLPELFKPWEVLKVLTFLLLEGNIAFAITVADRVGIVGVSEEIMSIRTTAVHLFRMRDRVLDLLSTGLVPYSSLVVDGLCEGNPVQQCHVCKQDVAVKNALVEYVWINTIAVEPTLVLGQSVTYTLCGSLTCFGLRKGLHDAGRKKLREVNNVLCGEHLKECCDYCGKLNHKAKGLRCAGCLTKLYCGVECQVKDTYHLQIKCERGEKRKKKRSDASRKKEGVGMLKERLEMTSGW